MTCVTVSWKKNCKFRWTLFKSILDVCSRSCLASGSSPCNVIVRKPDTINFVAQQLNTWTNHFALHLTEYCRLILPYSKQKINLTKIVSSWSNLPTSTFRKNSVLMFHTNIITRSGKIVWITKVLMLSWNWPNVPTHRRSLLE